MWDCNDSKDLVIELFNNKNNDELYYVDMDIMIITCILTLIFILLSIWI